MAPTAAFRPYVGAGLTYAYFYDTNGTAALSTMTGGRPTTFKVGSKLAPSLQLGAVYAVNDKWFVEASLIKTMLKNRTTLSTGNTVDYKINPTALNFAVGYRY